MSILTKHIFGETIHNSIFMNKNNFTFAKKN